MACLNKQYELPDIGFIGGGTQDLVFHAYFWNGRRPFDLSSCTAELAIINYVNNGGAPIFTKTMTVMGSGDGGEETNNILMVTLSPSDTVGLSGKYIYQVSIKDAKGDVEPPAQGIMLIRKNINGGFLN